MLYNENEIIGWLIHFELYKVSVFNHFYFDRHLNCTKKTSDDFHSAKLCIFIFTWTTERNRGGRAAEDDVWEVESVCIVENL